MVNDEKSMPEEKTEETMTSSTDEATQRFAEASQAFGIALSKLAEGITLWFQNVALPTLSELGEKLKALNEALVPVLKEMREKEELMNKGKVYGVSPRIMALCGHRKARVAKKNWSRLRKEVELYERKERYRGGQGPKQSYGSGSGDCQPDESLQRQAGCNEPVCRHHGEELELLGREK